MRIIGGTYKGRRIPVAGNLRARPTTDFARENLFNILSNHFDFEDCTVLDLFSGTGSISYEFASRGAQQVELVELDAFHYKFIKEVIDKLEFENVNTIKGRAEVYLRKSTKQYDLIFADPPYESKLLPQIPGMVFENNALKAAGWLILEHSAKNRFEAHPYFSELRRYGSVHFSIFKNR